MWALRTIYENWKLNSKIEVELECHFILIFFLSLKFENRIMSNTMSLTVIIWINAILSIQFDYFHWLLIKMKENYIYGTGGGFHETVLFVHSKPT